MTKPVTLSFNHLASAADTIKEEFLLKREEWKGSRFEWALTLPSGSKGKLGKRLAYEWCALNGLSVDRSPDSEADMLVNGHRTEVKLSMLWQGGGYTFQQLRDQNYEYAICLGISPAEAHCWVISKSLLMQHVIGHSGQHTGAKGKETAWFSVNPNNPPKWLVNCGGSLESAIQILKKLRRK
jgi:hypothetical protein